MGDMMRHNRSFYTISRMALPFSFLSPILYAIVFAIIVSTSFPILLAILFYNLIAITIRILFVNIGPVICEKDPQWSQIILFSKPFSFLREMPKISCSPCKNWQ